MIPQPMITPTGYLLRRVWTLLASASLAAVALSGCRQKMADQPYYRPLAETTAHYAGQQEGASARRPPEGTVRRGALNDDEALFTGHVTKTDAAGKAVREPVNEFPISITKAVIERGQQRFNIYCSPCHGFDGDGNGMIVQRGLQGPANFHSDKLSTAPLGHYFDVVTNGFGRMFPMEQIPVRDRWAIIAYVKALQLSQNAKLEDVPEAQRAALLAKKTTATTQTATGGHGPAPAVHANTSTGGAH